MEKKGREKKANEDIARNKPTSLGKGVEHFSIKLIRGGKYDLSVKKGGNGARSPMPSLAVRGESEGSAVTRIISGASGRAGKLISANRAVGRSSGIHLSY